MDSPPPIKKRITISRWGPALTTEEKAANVQAQQPLPNGTGTDNKETSDKVVCHIIKLNKTPNHKDKEKKPAEPVDTQNESSAIEDNVEKSPNDSSSSSDSSDFFGFDTCDLGKKEAFLRVLSKFRKSIEEDDDDDDQKDDVEEPVDETKPSTAEEKERIEKAESENLSQEENQSNEMTVDTRPEEEDEMDTSVDKSNSERMDVDEHQDTDPMTKDSEAVRSEEGTPEKGVDTPESDPVLDNENKDKDVDNMESISIKEEVLSITDDGKDMDDKLSETHMGSESSLVDSQQENDPLADSFNSQDTSVLNGTQQTSGKKRSGRESQRLKKPVVDVSNPVYLKPFDFGWKRELVYRSTSDSSVSSLKRQADVYYYTPKGKKVRSFREVVEHLVGQDLNIDNFTFFKEAIGVEDPEKEIIRDAKLKLSKDLNSSAPSPILKKTLTPKVSKVAKTPKTPKNTPSTSQEPVEDTPNASPNATPPPSTTKGVTPRVVFRGKSKLTAGTKFTATQSKTTVPGQAQKIIISKGACSMNLRSKRKRPLKSQNKKENTLAKKSKLLKKREIYWDRLQVIDTLNEELQKTCESFKQYDEERPAESLTNSFTTVYLNGLKVLDSVKDNQESIWNNYKQNDEDIEMENVDGSYKSGYWESGQAHSTIKQEHEIFLGNAYKQTVEEVHSEESTNDLEPIVTLYTETMPDPLQLNLQPSVTQWPTDICQSVQKSSSSNFTNMDYNTAQGIIIQKIVEPDLEDATDLFFKTMSATVKKFSPDLMNTAKRRIFKLVMGLENINRNLCK